MAEFTDALGPGEEPIEIRGPEDPVDRDDAWRVRATPSTLIIFMPAAAPADRETPPDAATAERALADGSGEAITILDRPDAPDPDVAWSFVVDVANLDQPLIVWCEPAEPMPPEAPVPDAVRTCRWTIGVQTLIARENPPAHFGRVMATLAHGFADAAAILDVLSNRMHDRAALDDLFGALDEGALEPPAAAMWLIHCVPDEQQQRLWLFTDGLRRCGRPELEMLDVAAGDRDAAVRVMNRAAGWVLERGAPAPGSAIEIGPDLVVTLQRAGDVARYVSDDVPGSLNTRSGDELATITQRAAICGVEPIGEYRKIWAWPRDVVGAVAQGRVALYESPRETARRTQRARVRWPLFVRAMQSAGDGDVRGAVKVARPLDSQGDPGRDGVTREHTWVDVRAADATTATPADPDHALVHASDISDWVINTPTAAYGPGQVSALRAAFDRERTAMNDTHPSSTDSREST